MANLGGLYVRQGKLAKAEPLLVEAEKGLRKAHGVDHPDTLTAMTKLAELSNARSEWEEAERLLVEVLEHSEKVHGHAHRHTLETRDALGATRTSLKDYAKAEAVLRECLKLRETLPTDWARYNTQSLLGGCLIGQKRHEEAERLVLAAYEGMKAREKNIPRSLKRRLDEALERIVQLYDAWGNKDKAEEWRQERADRVFDDPFAPH
jgi:tetratricopeptide (TPR) repeat protein